MNADTAAAIGSICAAVVSIAVVVGQVLLARRLDAVHGLVNGQSHALNAMVADKAYRQGVEAVAPPSAAVVVVAPPTIEPR